MVHQLLQELVVHQELVVLVEYQVLQEHQVALVLTVLQVHLEQQVPVERQVQEVHLEPVVSMGLMELVGHQVLMELMEQVEQVV